MAESRSQPTVAIVGGGLAGLAAACALSDSGFRVTLFERRPFLGGRASSYEHPGTGEVVDNCQHVLFGSCTNLIAFYRTIGILDSWSPKLELRFKRLGLWFKRAPGKWICQARGASLGFKA